MKYVFSKQMTRITEEKSRQFLFPLKCTKESKGMMKTQIVIYIHTERWIFSLHTISSFFLDSYLEKN